MINLRNFLPRDTRIIELASGISIVIYAFVMLADYSAIKLYIEENNSFAMLGVDRLESWILLCLVFGCLQVFAVVSTLRLTLIRAICAYVCGYFWLWEAGTHEIMFSVSSTFHLDGVLGYIVGIGNFFAFVVQVMCLRIKWTH